MRDGRTRCDAGPEEAGTAVDGFDSVVAPTAETACVGRTDAGGMEPKLNEIRGAVGVEEWDDAVKGEDKQETLALDGVNVVLDDEGKKEKVAEMPDALGADRAD